MSRTSRSQSIEVLLTPAQLKETQKAYDIIEGLRQYKQRSDQWGKGMKQDAMLIGMRGELAVKTYFNNNGLDVTWNNGPLQDGDRGIDLTVNGVSMQVKTGLPLIRLSNDYLSARVFIFVEPLHASRFLIRGWSNRHQVKHSKMIDGKGPWCNLLVEEKSPMTELLNHLKRL